jgi:hypothetical protein
VSLRAVRAQRSEFDARFFERDVRFAPIAEPARLIVAGSEGWPSVARIDEILRDRARIRFVPAKPRPRRQRGPVRIDDLYDAHIARGEVPTRERSWHDLLNALVWATFPHAKAALHARQHAAIRVWAKDPVVSRLPNARTRELDALALIDEGGIVLCKGGTRAIFGHALYEGLVFQTPAMIARALPLDGPLTAADSLLAARLTEPLTPESLPRVPC